MEEEPEELEDADGLLPPQAESPTTEAAKTTGQTKDMNLETIRFSMIFL